jgi:hypothetical protein
VLGRFLSYHVNSFLSIRFLTVSLLTFYRKSSFIIEGGFFILINGYYLFGKMERNSRDDHIPLIKQIGSDKQT